MVKKCGCGSTNGVILCSGDRCRMKRSNGFANLSSRMCIECLSISSPGNWTYTCLRCISPEYNDKLVTVECQNCSADCTYLYMSVFDKETLLLHYAPYKKICHNCATKDNQYHILSLVPGNSEPTIIEASKEEKNEKMGKTVVFDTSKFKDLQMTFSDSQVFISDDLSPEEYDREIERVVAEMAQKKIERNLLAEKLYNIYGRKLPIFGTVKLTAYNNRPFFLSRADKIRKILKK